MGEKGENHPISAGQIDRFRLIGALSLTRPHDARLISTIAGRLDNKLAGRKQWPASGESLSPFFLASLCSRLLSIERTPQREPSSARARLARLT